MDGLHCAFIGRVGNDAELRFTASGTPLVNVSVLVQDSKAATDAGQWVRVGHFGDDVEDLVPQLTKGIDVYVEGRLKLNTWQAGDGTPRSGLNVTAWRLEPIGQIGRRRAVAPVADRQTVASARKPTQARYMEALDGA
jgi:single-strand DNA-binding protein